MSEVVGPILFPREKFPIILEFLHPESRVVVHRIVVEEPEGLARVYIPGLSRQLGHRVDLRVTFGDGEVQEVHS